MTRDFKYNVAFHIRLVFIPLVGEKTGDSDLSLSAVWQTEVPAVYSQHWKQWGFFYCLQRSWVFLSLCHQFILSGCGSLQRDQLVKILSVMGFSTIPASSGYREMAIPYLVLLPIKKGQPKSCNNAKRKLTNWKIVLKTIIVGSVNSS